MTAAARQTTPEESAPRPAVIEKTAKVMALVEKLRADTAQLQAREAVTRVVLAEAVLGALSEAAEARAMLQGELAARSSPPRTPWRAPRRLLWSLRAVLARLGRPGQALLLGGSGMWRPGRPGTLARQLAVYVSKGPAAAAAESLFDPDWYLDRYADVAASGLSPMLHYLLVGQIEARDPHPLFATDFYMRRNAAELARDRAWPLAHFLHAGSRALVNPHPLFDSAHYAMQGARPLGGESIVSHYLREGWRYGLSPHPLFDPAWYRRQASPRAATLPPLLHYVVEGAPAGLSPHPLFDPAWYRQQAPDAGPDPLRHYVEEGAARGLSPSRWFDPQHYAARRGEALAPDANPLVDYLQGGAWAVAEPAPGFATAAYVAAHPELVAQGLTPLEHWARAAADGRLAD